MKRVGASLREPEMKPKIKSLLMYCVEAVVIVGILTGIYAYQSRNLLPTELQQAPALSAPLLTGGFYDLSEHAASTTLVYFFAPWCSICAASSGNIDNLRRLRSDDDLNILLVALDWQTQAEVQEYVDRHEITVSVLLGDRKITSEWNIYAFPTYYILDDEQRVIHRDLGYSTLAGLWWRTI
jgi:thiol-disulfide isomerase/thioredoxin